MKGLVLLCAIGLTASLASPSRAEGTKPAPSAYAFTPVAARCTEEYAEVWAGNINNAGKIAFTSLNYTLEGEPVARIRIADGAASVVAHEQRGPFYLSLPWINDAGRVAFGSGMGGTHALYVSDGGSATAIATGIFSFERSMNNAGQIAYSTGDPAEDIRSIYVVAAGAPPAGLGLGYGPDINDSGTVVFLQNDQLMLARGGSVSTVVPSGSPYGRIWAADINNGGEIAFAGPESGAFKRAADGTISPVAAVGTAYERVDSIAMNNHGKVAFTATARGGTSGVYTGPDPYADKVLAQGDPLFESTVYYAQIQPGQINDQGRMVLTVRLDNGWQGIVLAAPCGSCDAGHGSLSGSALMSPF